jgi:hypothetical protein
MERQVKTGTSCRCRLQQPHHLSTRPSTSLVQDAKNCQSESNQRCRDIRAASWKTCRGRWPGKPGAGATGDGRRGWDELYILVRECIGGNLKTDALVRAVRSSKTALQENDWFWNKGRRQPSGSSKVEESKETSRTFQRQPDPDGGSCRRHSSADAIGGNGSLESVRFHHNVRRQERSWC